MVCHFAGIAEPMKYLTKTSEVIDLTINPSINIINECSKHKKKFILHQLRSLWKS